MTDPVVRDREAPAPRIRRARCNPKQLVATLAVSLVLLMGSFFQISFSFSNNINHAPAIARTGTARLAAGSYRIYQDPEDVDFPLPASRVHIKGPTGRIQGFSDRSVLDFTDLPSLSTDAHEGIIRFDAPETGTYSLAVDGGSVLLVAKADGWIAQEEWPWMALWLIGLIGAITSTSMMIAARRRRRSGCMSKDQAASA